MISLSCPTCPVCGAPKTPETENIRSMSLCGHEPVITRAVLRERHGSPEEFERAVWNAWSQLFITTDEACDGILKYREEYYAAPW